MVQIDMPMQDNCVSCPLCGEESGHCLADYPQQRYTGPFCNPRYTWTADEHDGVSLFQDKPDWCPLKEVE